MKAFSVKSTPSGHLVVQEPTSNCLVVASSVGAELMRHQAANNYVFPSTFIRNAHFTDESDKIIWFSGGSEFSVVYLQDMRMIEYKNFLPSIGPNQDAIPLRALMKPDMRTIIISFIVDGIVGIAYLNPEVKEPNVYTLVELLPKFKSVIAMELGTSNTNLVFMVGQSQFDSAKKEPSYAMISCFKMNKHLDFVEEYTLSSRRFMGATAIKRLRSHTNEFVVGCFQSIVILEFSNGRFQEHMVFDKVHTDIIDDIAICGNRIFSVTRKDKFVHMISLNEF